MNNESTHIIRPQEGFQEKFVRSNVDVCFGGGVLNPQPLDSIVITPNGKKCMGDIQEGDVICDANGGLQVVNYIIKKGKLPCVRLYFDDDRKVECALEHHWKVYDKEGKELDISAEEIIQNIDENKKLPQEDRFYYQVPLAEPSYMIDDYMESKLIEPYTMGYLLSNSSFCEEDGTYFLSQNKEIADSIERSGFSIKRLKYSGKRRLYRIQGKAFDVFLDKIGLLGIENSGVFIPTMYKVASPYNRLQLLLGIMDSDNCKITTTKYGHIYNYITPSVPLILDIMDIAYSLGGKCKLSEYDGKKVCEQSELYKLSVLIPNQGGLKPHLYIDRYEFIGEKECQCINVSGDEHLYLTDNHIITRNCGKTFASILSVAEPQFDKNFRAVFLRNNLGDLKSGGGILDEFKNIYGRGVSVIESGDPKAVFPSGSKIDVTHIADQSREKVRQRFKGRQYDLIYFDELTGFTWECFTEVCTRNRGTAKWTGKIRGTTNPDRNHWLRIFLDWYIGIDGFIIEEREGVVRYFYINGESVKDVVWGDTKEEVYQQCKIDIDKKLKRINGKTGDATYQDLIRSFTFYLGRMSENKASLGSNRGYVGSVAMSGGRNAEQLLEGNWNVSPNESLDAPIPQDMAAKVFTNDPQINGDKWVTCDLADTGTDNFIAIAWNGFHIIDVLILGTTTPRLNANKLLEFAAKHDVADNHIIYDAIRGVYINDYIPEAIPFISYRHPIGMYGRMALKLKDECYLRITEMIKRELISIDDKLAYRIYEHQNLKDNVTIMNEFIEECAVVRFKDVQNGKKTLLTKKEMNARLGKGRSMDLLDPIAMRALPILSLPNGDELIGTMETDDNDDFYVGANFNNSVYSDSNWF